MKTISIYIFCSILTLSLCGITLARFGSEFVPYENNIMSIANEPTCEELRTMWRFSRRQSRAAEVTNEIPTYRDPFAYEVYQLYPKVRSVFGRVRSSARSWPTTVYGRIMQYPQSSYPRTMSSELLRYMDISKPEKDSRIQGSTYRFSEGPLPFNRLSHAGSFQKLKELIYAERIKDLQKQRLLEEAAAKSAYEINALNHNGNYEPFEPDLMKTRRLKIFNGETDVDSSNLPDLYVKPDRPEPAFDSDSPNEES